MLLLCIKSFLYIHIPFS